MLKRVWRKGNSFHCWWECKLIQLLWRTVWRFLKKRKIELPYDSSNPTTGHIPWENHNSKRVMYHNVHCITIYNSQDMEATKVSINRWIKMRHIYTMEYYSAIKINEIELFVVRWMDIESVKQSEVSQKEKNKYCMLTRTYGIKKKKVLKNLGAGQE